MLKLKKKLLAGLLGLALALCSCSESSFGGNITSSSVADTTTSQTEQTTTTTAEQTTTSQTTTARTTQQTTTTTASPQPSQNQPQGVPMWECTDKNGNTITLMGSMHAAKKDFYPLPDKIMNAYNAAEVVAFECDTEKVEDEQTQLQMQNEMTYSDGTTLKDKLSPEAYQVLTDMLAELDSTPEMIANFKPWAAYETITTLWIMQSDISVTNGIDYYLMKQTKTDGKQLFELEDAQVQIDMLTKQPDKTYDALFKAAKGATKKDALDSLANLYNAWLKGDIDYIEKEELGATDDEYKQLGLTDEEVALIRAREKATTDDRNVNMVKGIKQLCSSGKKVFVVVGAAHYCGKNGIVSLLEKEGYTFKRI